MTDRPMFNPAAFGSGKVEVAQVATDTTPFDPARINARFEAKRQAALDLRTAPLGPIKAWSMSRLADFETCPYSVYLTRVEKMPSPSGPAAERGSKIHAHIEGYIEGQHEEVIKEMRGFIKLIDLLREGYTQATVEIEGDWAFDRVWTPVGWSENDAWARFKLDALYRESDTSAMVIDWKTGRKFGNEMKHSQQGMGYAIAAFARYPELEYVSVKFAYLDQNDELTGSYTRQQAALLRPGLEERADRMTTCTEFAPHPSFHACRWCPHAKVQDGYDEPACRYAHEQVIH